MCIADGCDPDGCPCTLEGIEAAIARGGMRVIKCGANAPPVSTRETIIVDNDVTMDGQGNLTVQGDDRHLLFDVQPFEVEMIGFTITRGDLGIRVAADATLTLTNSVVKGNTSTFAAGGGIHNEGTLTLRGSEVADNRANENVVGGGGGGGIYNSSTGVLTLTNSKVRNNVSASGPGGGIQNDRGSVSANQSEVTENDAMAHDGGGISNVDGTVTVVNSTIRDNTTARFGGGLSNRGFSATMHITDSTVSGNRSANVGGGIRSQHGELQVTRTTWTGNHANNDGGALVIEGDDGVATIVSSTVSGNSADRVGGGIRVFENALARIINTTIYDNSAADGGALHLDFGASAEVRSSTISNNDDVGRLGIPIAERTSASIVHLGIGTLSFIQSIIDDTCVAVGTTMSLDHNIESPGDTCRLDAANDMVNVTPEALNLADQLADNDNEGGTLTLLLTRPSVAVDYLISTCDQPRDQRGVSRPQGTDCDIGAVEIE
jgi:hypothetical protein